MNAHAWLLAAIVLIVPAGSPFQGMHVVLNWTADAGFHSVTIVVRSDIVVHVQFSLTDQAMLSGSMT